jgi:hypothetical protein
MLSFVKPQFEELSGTVGDAALAGQVEMRESLDTLATLMSKYVADTPGMEWPFTNIQGFEQYGQLVRRQAHCEMFAFAPKVKSDLREVYEEYATANYESMIKDAHKIDGKGFLKATDNSSYNPYISTASAQGFIPAPESDVYYPVWHISPPPAFFGLTNWNMDSVPQYHALLPHLEKIKNETMVSLVKPYLVAVPNIFSEEDHDAMHSKFSEGSSSDYPHSFVFVSTRMPTSTIQLNYSSLISFHFGTIYSIQCTKTAPTTNPSLWG